MVFGDDNITTKKTWCPKINIVFLESLFLSISHYQQVELDPCSMRGCHILGRSLSLRILGSSILQEIFAVCWCFSYSLADHHGLAAYWFSWFS